MTAIPVGPGGQGIGATLSMLLSVDGWPQGPAIPPLFNSNSPQNIQTITLNQGDNVIDFPAGAGFLAVSVPLPLPGSGITFTTRSKNVTGDSGEVFVGVLAKGLSQAPPGSGTNAGSFIINVMISGATTIPGVVVACL